MTNEGIAKLSKKYIPISKSRDGLILCPYCLAIKTISKKFKNNSSLSNHITRYHESDFKIIDITNVSGVEIPKQFYKKMGMWSVA